MHTYAVSVTTGLLTERGCCLFNWAVWVLVFNY